MPRRQPSLALSYLLLLGAGRGAPHVPHKWHQRMHSSPAAQRSLPCVAALYAELPDEEGRLGLQSLCSEGFNFTVHNPGRLGNQLVSLSHGIFAARATKSLVRWPANPPFWGAHHLDFRAPGAPATPCAAHATTSEFFFEAECVHTQQGAASMRARRALLRTYVRPLLRVPPAPTGPEVLVIHVRSGDVFGPAPNRGYTQPPLAFYTEVLAQGEYARVLLVTEPDRASPVLDELAALPEAEVVAGPVEEAVGLLLGATHLVAAASTFSEMLGVLGEAVAVHVPFCDKYVAEHLGGPLAHRGRLNQGASPAAGGVPGFCYDFPDYPRPGEWTASPDQRELMLTYPASKVVRLPLPDVDPDA